MRRLILVLSTALVLTAPACMVEEESGFTVGDGDEGAQSHPYKVPSSGSGSGPIATSTVPIPGPTATAPPKLPGDCRTDGSCNKKCDDAATLFTPTTPANVLAACLEVCKQNEGGQHHSPGAFMLDCTQNNPPNGCGPDGPLGSLVPSGSWGGCCDTHDACYLAGGDSASRCDCDQRLAMCVALGGGGGAASTYFTAVSKFGCEYYNWDASGHPGYGPGGVCIDYGSCSLVKP